MTPITVYKEDIENAIEKLNGSTANGILRAINILQNILLVSTEPESHNLSYNNIIPPQTQTIAELQERITKLEKFESNIPYSTHEKIGKLLDQEYDRKQDIIEILDMLIYTEADWVKRNEYVGATTLGSLATLLRDRIIREK